MRLSLSWLTAWMSGMASVCLMTLWDSPVRILWSTFRQEDMISNTRMSAGALSPTGGGGLVLVELRSWKRAKEVWEMVRGSVLENQLAEPVSVIEHQSALGRAHTSDWAPVGRAHVSDWIELQVPLLSILQTVHGNNGLQFDHTDIIKSQFTDCTDSAVSHTFQS